MARVFVGVGSNIDRDANIRSGVQALRAAFGKLTISRVYRSEAIGFKGDDFYNLVVAFDTDSEPREVANRLRAIERQFGRDPATPGFAPRTLDLDLLLYNSLVAHEQDLDLPREDIGKYAFVLRPLAEIAGDSRHPVSGQRFADLWAGFEFRNQDLKLVKMDLDTNEPMNAAEP